MSRLAFRTKVRGRGPPSSNKCRIWHGAGLSSTKTSTKKKKITFQITVMHFKSAAWIWNTAGLFQSVTVTAFCHSDIRLKWCLRNCSLELEMTQISNLYSKASFLMSHRLLHWVRDKQLIKNEKWSLISLHKCDPARNSQILLKLQKTWNCEPGRPELTQTWWDIQGTALCRIFGLLWCYEEGRVSSVLTQAQSDTDLKPLKSELFFLKWSLNFPSTL